MTAVSPTDTLIKQQMEAARANKTISTSSASSQSTGKEDAAASIALNAFVMRNGRRYLRDLPYPLPCDLPELNRQNLQTLLTTSVFGKALCSPHVLEHGDNPKVLELACGSGYWSSLCHDHLISLGKSSTSFVGLDAIHLAPDMRKQGMNWRFVQHDLRRVPLPFEDEEFDIVVLKDLSLVVPLGAPQQKMIDESLRLLKRGGILEIWDHDHVVRSLLPHPPHPPGKQAKDDELARQTATFLISPGTPFAAAQNKYLQDSNAWIQEALDRRKLSPTPCARIAQMLLQEAETLSDIGYRRLAIPLGEMRWEASADKPAKGKGKTGETSCLTPEQSALRSAALLTVVQKIESMEHLLKDVSGKSQEEWQRWWAWMMADLLENRGASSGECLEVGAWWAKKV
jgi:SAM-dependent methyltransferase